MTIPFGRWRLVVSMSRFVSPPAPPKLAQANTFATHGTAIQLSEAIDAADQELAKLSHRAALEADRRRWQALAILHGFRG
jgi:hypothetical protein